MPAYPGFYDMVLIRFTAPVDDAFFRQGSGLGETNCLFYYFGAKVSDRSKSFTHCNLSVFESSRAHDRYQVHPLHKEIRALMVPRMEIVVCDLDVPKPPW